MRRKILSMISAFALAAALGLFGIAGESVQAAGFTSTVQSCAINGDNVVVTAAVPAGQPSDDGTLYLFELPTYAAGLTGEPVATAPMGQTASFTTPLNNKQANSKLYSKFAVAVKSGGNFVQISEAKYIANPEAVAEHTMEYPSMVSKKGLQIFAPLISTGEIEDLGIKHSTFDIVVNRLFGPTTNAAYPTINYTYNGKTYQLDGYYIRQVDGVIQALSDRGVVVSAILLNELDADCMQTTHPLARTKTTSPYYMMNGADQNGVDYLSAAASFLALRYSGIGCGRVDNWIIGNEVTARSEWNYIAPMDVVSYTEEYAKVMRLFYTGIKSVNANARVYISIDQTWNRNLTTGTGYDGRDVIDALSANSIAKGNFDWGVAFHPYPVPLTWPKFWNMPSQYRAMNLVSMNENTPMVTPQNMFVVTDYMCKAQNLDSKGQVRSLIVSEVGFPSSLGQEVQAAALSYAYLNAKHNQHIDAFIAVRDIDYQAEINQGLPMGLKNVDGSPKAAYNVYKYIDIDESVTAPYLKQIGISSWSQVIQAR